MIYIDKASQFAGLFLCVLHFTFRVDFCEIKA